MLNFYDRVVVREQLNGWPEGWDEPEVDTTATPRGEDWGVWIGMWRNREEHFKLQISVAHNAKLVERLVAEAEKEAKELATAAKFYRPITINHILKAAEYRKMELLRRAKGPDARIMARGPVYMLASSPKEHAALLKIGFVEYA